MTICEMKGMKDEKYILCKLIDYVERNMQCRFIAREVPYDYSKRRCDLLVQLIDKKQNVAFEVKSDMDSLQRISGQLESYRSTFNVVYVVTTRKYLDKVKLEGGWFGILLVDDYDIVLARKPRARKNLDKKSQLSVIDSVGIRSLASKNGIQHIDKITSTNLLATLMSREEVSSELNDWLAMRYVPLYRLFLKERANYTTSPDLEVLALRSDVVQKLDAQ